MAPQGQAQCRFIGQNFDEATGSRWLRERASLDQPTASVATAKEFYGDSTAQKRFTMLQPIAVDGISDGRFGFSRQGCELAVAEIEAFERFVFGEIGVASIRVAMEGMTLDPLWMRV